MPSNLRLVSISDTKGDTITTHIVTNCCHVYFLLDVWKIPVVLLNPLKMGDTCVFHTCVLSVLWPGYKGESVAQIFLYDVFFDINGSYVVDLWYILILNNAVGFRV